MQPPIRAAKAAMSGNTFAAIADEVFEKARRESKSARMPGDKQDENPASIRMRKLSPAA